MQRILMALFLVFSTWPAVAATGPQDVIHILKIEGSDASRSYHKKFKDLVLDDDTLTQLKAVERKLEQDYQDKIKLHALRVGLRTNGKATVERAMFRGKFVFAIYSSMGNRVCITGIGGNGMILHTPPENCM